MKHVCIIAYYLPPSNKVGVYRPFKFAKYLSRKCRVSLVSVTEAFYESKDSELINELKDSECMIYRFPAFAFRLPYIHEEGFYWWLRSGHRIVKLIKRLQPDYIIITGNPFGHFILGLMVKYSLRIPYILDFRDPWVLNPYNPRDTFARKALTNIESIIECLVVSKANIVLNVTDYATELYKTKYDPLNCTGKFYTIPNGYDPSDFTNVSTIEVLPAFTILYPGKFGSFRDPVPFVKAFKRFTAEHKEACFVHAGQREDRLERAIHEYGLSDQFKALGMIPYRLVLDYINSVDACLLITGNHKYEPTTKIYDYIALGKKIIAATIKDGYVAQVLQNYTASYVVENNENNIYNALVEAYSSPDQSGYYKGQMIMTRQEQADFLFNLMFGA